MPNSFQVLARLQEAADDAAVLLHASLVAMGLVNRRVESNMVPKGGGQVTVWVRPTLTGNFDEDNAGAGTLTVTDNTQTAVTLTATKYAYSKQTITTKQLTYDLGDFAYEVTEPAVAAVAEQIEQFAIRRIAGGFARYVSGTAGTSFSTAAHVLAARQAYHDRKAPMRNLACLMGTTPELSLLQIDNFANADYGADGPTAMREAMLARRWGIGFFVTPNAGGDLEEGDEAGTVLANGVGTAADTTVSMDAFTASTGTIREGTRFTVAGDSTEYAVTADTAIASNAVTAMPIAPAVVTGWSDNAAVTFLTPIKQDVLFNVDAVAGAVVAPQPLATNSVVGTFENISVRLTIDSTTAGSSGATDSLLVDAYTDVKVLRRDLGQIVQG